MDSLNQFKISLRANNQITITRQRLAKKKEDRYESHMTSSLSQNGINSLVVRYAAQNGLQTTKKFYDPKVRIVGYKGKTLNPLQQALLLDITSKFQRDNSDVERAPAPPKRGYGLKPTLKNFGHRSGQKIRECGGAIDILCNGEPSKCRVITLTLPASGEDAYEALSNWSGYATNRLLQVIRREKDATYHWFYCWEHQKRGALHMHLCLYHEKSERSYELGEKLVSKWRDILRDIGGLSGVDLLYSKGFGRVVTPSEMQSINQEMHKGCGAYFSKYASKTSHGRESREVEDINTINARRYPPSSFWGRSQNLAKLCELHSFHYKFDGIYSEESESLQAAALEVLSQFNISINHSFSFKKELEYKGNGKLTIAEGISHVFYVSPSDYQHLLAHFRFMYRDAPTSAILERSKKRGVTVQSYTGGGF